jgi:hypothetical protein
MAFPAVKCMVFRLNYLKTERKESEGTGAACVALLLALLYFSGYCATLFI